MSAAVSLPVMQPMPRTRGECVNGQRPCPHSRCEHHMVHYVASGNMGRPSVARGPTESCVLDVADRGGATNQEVGDAMGVSRCFVSLIEVRASRRPEVVDALREWADHVPHHHDDGTLRDGTSESSDRDFDYELDRRTVRLDLRSDRLGTEETLTKRAWSLYVSGGPCWRDRACLAGATHAGPCVVSLTVQRERARCAQVAT